MMNRSDRRTVLLGMAASLALPAGAIAAAAHAGEVETSRGDCFAQKPKRPLATGEEVFVGEMVGTGVASLLGLHLGKATTVRLGAESQLKIDRFIANAGGVLTLDRGAMLYDHDPSQGADNTTVRSPFGLLAVRGTRFFAGPSNGVFGVFVEQGEVTVTAGGVRVGLTAGQGTNIPTPGADASVPTLWGAARIAAAMAQFKI